MTSDPHPLQSAAHQNSLDKGFWDDLPAEQAMRPMYYAGKISLIHQELSELLDAHRDDPYKPCDKPVELSCEEEEMADVLLRLFDLAGQRGIDLIRAAQIKHDYNVTRPHKHGRKF